ncbi:MAG: efflux transporter periplasmic adaptor subunit [Gammaproteobacteria bacterium]|jgi:multidrug resistance efflux pump|nr:efflux transporter periplasmic adaptor subunit [Gammaproteobacteria bacterium]
MKLLLLSLARWSITALIVLAATLVALWLWSRYETAPWTRDGHVYADVVRVSPDISGLVTEVAVHDNEVVHKGQLLFVVDRPRYTDALAQADAAIASARATLEQARRVARRDRALAELVATEAREEDDAKVQTSLAALNQVLAASRTAQLNLDRTAVIASVNGYVTNLSLRPGDYLGAGTEALAMIDLDSIRIEAYLEETKLRNVEVGDQARIRLMGDEEDLLGHVESIAGGIADDQRSNSPNLLPTVNATFTWVRLAQRIPVRIHVDQMPAATRLILGRTATVSILPSNPRKNLSTRATSP